MKKITKAQKERQFVYLTDLASIVEGTKATKAQKRKLLKANRIFSGLEDRPIV